MGVWSPVCVTHALQTFLFPVLNAPFPSYNGLLLFFPDLMTSWIWIYLSCDSTSVFIVTWCPMIRSFPSYGQATMTFWKLFFSCGYFFAADVRVLLQNPRSECYVYLLGYLKIPLSIVIYCRYHQYTWWSCKGRSGFVKNIHEVMGLVNGKDGGKTKQNWNKGSMTLAFGLKETPHSILICYAPWHLPDHMTQPTRQHNPVAKPSLALDLIQN